MKAKKRVLGQLEKCYALAMLEYNGKKHFLVAAEKKNKCLLFALDGTPEETVWEGPGGVMSMVQVPGSNGIFLATHCFYSPNDSANAKIVMAEPLAENNWRVRTLAELPFVHRFDILQRDGVNYLIACTLKSGHKEKDDWTSPGRVYAAVLPEEPGGYGEDHPLQLRVIAEGYTKNHGYYRGNPGPCDNALISCGNGIYHFTAPEREKEQWSIEKLLDTPASDAVLLDMDGDGEKELFVMSPFHGDTVSIYKKRLGKYEKIYEYPEKLEFLHALFGGDIHGIPTVIAGHRQGKQQLMAFRYDRRKGYLAEVLDAGAGAANVLHYTWEGKELVIAANRETNEIAEYELTEERDACLKEYTIGLYEKAMPAALPWREKLQAAKEAGYDYVEMSIDETEERISRIDMSQEERLQLVAWMYETGIPIRSMCVSALTRYSLGNADPALRSRGMEIIRGAIRLADDLGIRIVMIPGYDVYYENSTAETQKRFAGNLRRVADMAASYGVTVGIETMENNFMNTVWKAMYYVQQIDSVYLNVYPDSGNMKNAAVSLGSDEIQDLLAGRGHITSLHLKETAPGIFREIPYGQGHVDFEKMIETAWEIGIRKYVTEFWYQGNPAWKEEIMEANRRMRSILDRVSEERKEEDET